MIIKAWRVGPAVGRRRRGGAAATGIVAIFYPFSQFCEINISLLSLQTQPNTAPNLFQRGVEYGKYDRRPRARRWSPSRRSTSQRTQGEPLV